MRALRLVAAVALLTASLVALSAAPALAATIAVTTTTDVVNPGDGVISLREAFIIANSNETDDVIELESGVEYELNSCFVGELPHTQGENLTVNGNGSTIYQTCIGERIINNDNSGATMVLNDLSLTGGLVPPADIDGAAVKTRGPLTLDNVTAVVNNAGPGGTVIDAGNSFDGDDADLTVIDSFISSNTGDGIYISGGPVAVTNSSINNNTGSGIALIDGTPVTIVGSSISDNGGSGVRTTGQGFSSMTITNSTIDGNGNTGASCSACNFVAVTSSSISGNGLDPSEFGGGLSIFNFYNDSTNTYTITNSNIDNNSATREGGGIRLAGSAEDGTVPQAELTITGSTVDGNTTSGAFDIDGGGIYADTGNVTISSSSVSNNAAGPVGGFTASKGGAIYLREESGLDTDSSLSISDSTLIENDANWQGGAIWAVTSESVTIADSTVSGNAANSLGGGGLYASGADVMVLRSTFDDNSADVGGGIALAEFSGYPEGSLMVEDTTISNNVTTFAASGGGGVFVNVGDAGVDATFTNSTISGNESANQGGGIMAMQTSSVTLIHTTVAGNTGVNGANVFTAARPLTTTASVIGLPLGGDNCDVSSTSSGGFNFADDTSCGLGGSDVVDAGGPDIGPLTDNGGPTASRLPGAGSPLLGLVPAASCASATDQRGVARPQGTDCEAGSVEVNEAGTPNVIEGTSGADVLIGTPGDDIIYGFGGDDIIEGRGGNDVLIGGPGNDRLQGGGGDDELIGNGGNDILRGGSGADFLEGRAGNDTLRGGPGDDLLAGNRGEDVLRGGANDDTLFGGPDPDLLLGGSGADDIRGGGGGDEAHGDRGGDTLIGDRGGDLLLGGAGADFIEGRAGNDTLRGGNGPDLLAGNQGNDTLRGGAGFDTLFGGPGVDNCNAGSDGGSVFGC